MDTKSIFTSVTFWGSITSLAAMFYPKLFAALGWDAPTTASYIVAGIGFVITVIGRFRANSSTPVSFAGGKK